MKLYPTFKQEKISTSNNLFSAVLLALFLSPVLLPGQAPSSVLPDVVNFKIQYPLDENGNDYTGVAWEDRDDPHINSENIIDLVDYVAPLPYQDYFYVDGNEVVFKAHCAGALTSINAYPRTELRERPGGIDGFWNFNDEQELNATFRVTHLPDVKQEVCILQIKGNTTTSTSNTSETLRLEYRANSGQGLHLVVNETTTLNDIMNYSLGETIEARLYVNDGDVTVELTNISTGDTYFNQYASAYEWGYFKAGCYTQSSIWEEKNGVGDELPTAYGEVRFSELTLGVTCTPVLPADLAATDVAETSVTLNWEYEAGMDHYNVRYRPIGSDTWEFMTSLRLSEGDFTVSGSTVVLEVTGLTEGTPYEWQARAKCPDGSATNYNDGAGPAFTTLASALPVELIRFSGIFKKEKNRVDLAWQTASEIDNKGFNIERTEHPQDGFEVIGWVDGKGNSNSLNEYSFNDKIIETGKRYYYRLRQIDFDGGSAISEIVTIETGQSEKDWKIFPNPVSDNLSIRPEIFAPSAEGLVQIVDANGKIVFEKSYLFQREAQLTLSIGHLSTGIYTLLVKNDRGEIFVYSKILRSN